MTMERTLLLVDDEAEIGAALSRLLRQDGYKILCAHSGQEGLELLAKHKVNVIVSDQRMPGMTGVEFLSRAKELCPDTVRIILSGYADLNSVTDAINRGAIYKFLTKPWDNESLCANVLEAFGYYDLVQQKRNLALEIQEANATLAGLSLDLSKLVADKDSQIARISHYDPLTNLANRSLFLDRLNQALEAARANTQALAVLLIDLDHFHTVNDNYGLAAGDLLLQAVAKRLSNHAGGDNTISRMGDNEFGLLLSVTDNSQMAAEIARQILDAFVRDPVAIGKEKIYIGACIGIGIYPSAGLDANTLIKNASAALRRAKRQGHSNILTYAEQMDAAA